VARLEKVDSLVGQELMRVVRDNFVRSLLVMAGEPMLVNHCRANGSNRAIVVKIESRACVSRNDVRSERNNADIGLKIN
jgi:hypothetical protein